METRLMGPNPSVMTPNERRALLQADFEEAWPEPPAGWLLVGGFESELLWQATVDSFVSGVWVATTLCAQATVERCLAGMVSLQRLPGLPDNEPPKNWTKWGLGSLIDHVRTQDWVPSSLLDDVQTLCEVRKPWGHWREPFEPGSIQRRTIEAMGQLQEGDFDSAREQLLAQEAHESAVTALRLYFGNYRGGPYLGTEGSQQAR